MADVLAFPFRFLAGRAVRVEQDSTEDIGQQLASVLMTRPGERELVPTFGVQDPTFVGCDANELRSVLALHLPHIALVDVAHDHDLGHNRTSCIYYYESRSQTL